MALNNHIVPDSPTNNFCTLNPLNLKSNQVLLESNLRFKTFTTNDSDGATSTVAMPNSGKYYIEVVPHDTLDYNSRILIGVTADPSKNTISQNYVAGGPDSYSWTERTGVDYHFRSEGTSFLFNGDCPTFTVNAIYQIFYDSDNLKIWMGKNNNWYSSSGSISGTPNFSTDQTMQVSADLHQKGMFFIIQIASELGQVKTVTINFGQDPTFAGSKSPTTTYTDANGIGAFYYQPPTGAKALCTANLPDFTPTVTGDVPADYFKAVKYTGQLVGDAMTAWDGTTGTIECGFPVDLAWIKVRNASGGHRLYDTVRGANQILTSNETSEERTFADEVTGFHSTGFYVGNASIGGANTNFVSWCWKAGGPPDLTSSPTKPFAKNGVQYETLSAANITAGTITPTAMSVNTDAGFSIVKYGGSNTTGLLSSSVSSATIPHGLNDCEFCIIKNIRWTNTWVVSHRSITPNVMSLQDSGQAASTPPVDPAYGQITTLGSNTITITRGSTRGDNVGEDLAATNGQFEYIAYCWHSVENYSKCGSYTGNGSADGPFVYCGFRPAWVMIKQSSSSGEGWYIVDTARDTYNAMGTILIANSSGGDNTSQYPYVDYVSNGFKLRKGWHGVNATNGIYIFMAFSEQPSKFSNAR